MFYLTPQERRFVCLVVLVFAAGTVIQWSFKRDIAPMRWARHVRAFKIDINTAGPEQLQMLPGIGARLSKAIIDYRQSRGCFKRLQEIREVDGITAKRFKKIKDLIKL